MRRTIMVTGSSGFVGTNFIKSSPEYNIIEIDLLSTKVENIDFSQCDCVFHLAALVHQMHGAPREKYFNINRDLTFNVAKRAKAQGVYHFIFMSTTKVYGESTKGMTVWDENSECKPVDPYGESKLQAEQLIRNIEDEHFKVAIIRSPLIYGPGVKANMYNLIKLLDKYPVLPFGGIQNKRSMVCIGNLIAMAKQIINRAESGIFVAGDPQPVSTSALSRLIVKNLNREVYFIRIPKLLISIFKFIKPSVILRIWGSLELENSFTNQKLDFVPPYTTEEGIREMVKWYCEEKQGYNK